ncbi:Phage Tail Collar Domain [Escherichia coli]|uniref:phage tail protein n=1 Tax=Escherichia coli TaxID=562 RepID=UPI001A388926|nr:phage tail protein [Escherichia coli]VVZ39586.1 Phage Tail Collar Domain [Escherichia coli]VWN14776.1 Phage Tail Collar Domain [Escherichia coli]
MTKSFADIKNLNPQKVGLGEGSALPVGVPVPWPSATPPTGWLKCNGADFSAEEYPELAKAYPTKKLPDLRGEFIRGWDDGRGVDSGRGLLAAQEETKITNYHGDGGSNDDISAGVSGSPPKNFVRNPDSIVNPGSGFAAFGSKDLTVNGITYYFGVRPRNIAFNYIVRAA